MAFNLQFPLLMKVFYLSLPLCISFNLLLRVSTAQGAPLCKTVVESIYSSADFKSSQFQVQNDTKNTAYSLWAAEQANEAMVSFLEGHTPYSVLFKLADARKALNPSVQTMGQLRISLGGRQVAIASVTDSWATGLHSSYFSSHYPNNRRQELLSLAYDRIKSEKLESYETVFAVHQNVQQFPENIYTTLKNDRIKTSSIYIKTYEDESESEPEIYHFIRHTNPTNVPAIMKDVIARIKLLGDKDLDRKTKVLHFLTAMYGYYNAMPFKRGSAAIGRSFFAGLFAARFGSKLPELEDSLDVIAMLMTQEAFVARYQDKL